MKKIKFYLGALAMIAFVSFLSSCKSDTKVTITVTPDQVTAAPGDAVSFKVILSPDAINGGELGELTIKADTQQVAQKTFSGTQSDSTTFIFTVPSTAKIGSTIQLTFTAVDGKSGQSSTVGALITVGQNIPEIVSKTKITSNFISDNLDNKAGIILGSDDVQFVAANNADADLEYAYNGQSYHNSIVSPDCPWLKDVYSANGLAYDYSTQKHALLKKYSGTKSFADLTAEDISNLSSDLTSSSTLNSTSGTGNGVTDLNNGDVIIFKTKDGRYGALKVDVISKAKANGAKFEASITFDIKYQSTAANSGK
jgi:hypothetical protein